MRRRVAVLAALLALLGAGCAPGLGEAGEADLLVSAASDLRPAFDELADRFEAETGETVTVVYGSSGQLAQQLLEGAPADLFAAADVAYVEAVIDAGRADPTTQATYAFGRVVLWAPADMWNGWQDLADVAADADVGTLALANPEHAPYGRAAQEALEAAGLAEDLADRLVLGEHIADTHRLAASGNADAALTALSLAVAAGEEGAWRLVPEDLHAPLEQALVVVADEPERAARAEAFAAFVDAPEGRTVMRAYGFLLPGEDPPEAWAP